MDRYLELKSIKAMRPLSRDEHFEFDALQKVKNAAAQDPRLRQAKADLDRKAAEAEQRNAAANTERAFQTVFSTVVGKPSMLAIDNEANRREIVSWLHPGEVVPAGDVRAWFLRVLQETPDLAKRIAWKEYLTPAQQLLQQKEDQKRLRQQFESACKNHGLAPNEANFQVWSSVPNPIISSFDSEPVIVLESGETLSLVPATQQQIDTWKRESDQKKFNDHQEHLQELAAKQDVTELRKIAATEAAERQLTSFEKRRNYSMLANFIQRHEKDKEPLPEYYRGRKLTADTIKKGGAEVIRDLGKRCGFERLNCLLYNLLPVEEFFENAEAKLNQLAAEEYHEFSFTR